MAALAIFLSVKLCSGNNYDGMLIFPSSFGPIVNPPVDPYNVRGCR